jgi:hypothetical protein
MAKTRSSEGECHPHTLLPITLHIFLSFKHSNQHSSQVHSPRSTVTIHSFSSKFSVSSSTPQTHSNYTCNFMHSELGTSDMLRNHTDPPFSYTWMHIFCFSYKPSAPFPFFPIPRISNSRNRPNKFLYTN